MVPPELAFIPADPSPLGPDGPLQPVAIATNSGRRARVAVAGVFTGCLQPLRSMVHDGYLYVAYTTNKEDVEYTRVPLSSLTP